MTTKTENKYIGISHGTPAPGDRIPVNIALAKFQRPKNKKKIVEYINKSKGVDWNLFGYATAVRYPDGTLELINGQHRIGVVKDTLPDVTEVPAHIIDVDDAQYAASLFYDMNGGASATLKSEEQFLARIYAGDKHALLLQSILEKTRFSIGDVNSKPGHRSIKYANFLKCVKFGSNEFLRASEIIDTKFPTGAVNDNLLSGMTRLFAIEHYKDLADKNKAIGEAFEKWIENHANNGVTQKDLEFRGFRNAGPWYDAAAYGLARFFLKTQRSKGKASVKLDVIRKIWESHNKDDSDSGFF